MTVAKLISCLQKLPQDLEVRIYEEEPDTFVPITNAVRAEMRAAVKRLLRKYKYPPDRQESAVSLVIEQAELFAHELVEGR